jgi:flagellar biosynthetic protein FliR
MPPLDATLATLIAAFVRAAAFTIASPVLSAPTVPPKVRVSLAATLALVSGAARDPLTPDALFAVLPLELMLGLVAGFAVRLALAGLETAGHLLGLLLGLGFASFFDPSSGDQQLPTGRIAFYLGGVAFLEADGLEHALLALTVVPATPTSLDTALRALFDGSAHVLVSALRAAAPLLLANLASNLTAALASKAAPALNVFSALLALFLLIGGAVLLVTSPAFMQEVLGTGLSARDAIERTFTP